MTGLVLSLGQLSTSDDAAALPTTTCPDTRPFPHSSASRRPGPIPGAKHTHTHMRADGSVFQSPLWKTDLRIIERCYSCGALSAPDSGGFAPGRGAALEGKFIHIAERCLRSERTVTGLSVIQTLWFLEKCLERSTADKSPMLMPLHADSSVM